MACKVTPKQYNFSRSALKEIPDNEGIMPESKRQQLALQQLALTNFRRS
jgi:hypothetical protein